MAVLTTTCPHCGADPMPLQVVACWKRDDSMVVAFVYCPKCCMPSSFVVAKAANPTAIADWFISTASVQDNIDLLTASGWMIVVGFPTPADKSAPQHTPPDIDRVFKQAAAARQRTELDAAAILFGKVIEITTKHLDATLRGTLQQRIDALAQSGKISDQLKQWAHETRIVRNDAAHEATEPEKRDVDEIAEFVEAFLEHVFTLPTKFANRQSRKKK